MSDLSSKHLGTKKKKKNKRKQPSDDGDATPAERHSKHDDQPCRPPSKKKQRPAASASDTVVAGKLGTQSETVPASTKGKKKTKRKTGGATAAADITHTSGGSRATKPGDFGSAPVAKGSTGDSELDDIFGALKKRKGGSQGSAKPNAQPAAAATTQQRPRRMDRNMSVLGMDARADGEAWEDDGLGGIYNQEGWTGRTTDDGCKIFKTHLLKDKCGEKAGCTPQCPFDCDCCFI
eukprot:m.48860 g.48860  ORF g.48860 m.48860 type:complete len:235 (+) comp12028_c0_seq2:79-783(+)